MYFVGRPEEEDNKIFETFNCENELPCSREYSVSGLLFEFFQDSGFLNRTYYTVIEYVKK